MRKLAAILVFLCIAIGVQANPNVNKIDPSYWYAGMKNPELQLMVYGEGIGSSSVSVNYPGVTVSSTVKLESNNYLLVYLQLDKEIKPGKMMLTFTEGKKKTTKEYEFKSRDKKGEERMGFDASDVLYMLMPDRFANGDPSNDNQSDLAPYKTDRNDPNARHGGDLAGIEKNLDYFNELGVTTIWMTPVLENNMTGGSYHGYATTDYYKVDPRFGSNQAYRAMIDKAHGKGLKMVMDMIFNHCGDEHIWIKDMPSKDWFNNSDYKNKFVQTSFRLTPHVDPYASKTDFEKMNDGWFVSVMPDLNQRNPHVLRYLIQNSFWWIESSGIDGIRMDTHPYAEYHAMAKWLKELDEEYPNYNVVGECWVGEPAFTAYWQKDSKLAAPNNSYLKTVMDFALYDKVNQAANETAAGSSGLDKVYNTLVYDFLYPNPSSVMAFIENHDTDRFLQEGQNIAALKQAMALLLTTRRIPQLYYGTEIMMNGRKNVSDGYVRKNFPGGWQGDVQNALQTSGRTPIQKEAFDFISNILQWRKGNEVISKGDLVHFMPINGTYVYARSLNGKTVLVVLNGTDVSQELPMAHYSEVTKGATNGKDIISKAVVNLNETLQLSPRQSLIIEF